MDKHHKEESSTAAADEFYGLEEVLEAFQKRGSTATKEQLLAAFQSRGYNPAEAELQEMLEGATVAGGVGEADADAAIDISYFLELMKTRMKDEDSMTKLKDAFRVFDKDQNGFISAAELRQAMKKMGQNLSDKDVGRMIRLADVDEDGQVDYEEFVNMMLSRS